MKYLRDCQASASYKNLSSVHDYICGEMRSNPLLYDSPLLMAISCSYNESTRGKNSDYNGNLPNIEETKQEVPVEPTFSGLVEGQCHRNNPWSEARRLLRPHGSTQTLKDEEIKSATGGVDRKLQVEAIKTGFEGRGLRPSVNLRLSLR